MKKHVHEEGDNKENDKKEERSFEKSNKQIYGCKKKLHYGFYGSWKR